MELSLYRYRPLEGKTWIRVLRLLPDISINSPLQCHIIHLDRKQVVANAVSRVNSKKRKRGCDEAVTSYEAVSYVWGKADFTQQLTVLPYESVYSLLEMRDWEGCRTIMITRNVETMLRYFRKRDEVLDLWIDAVCLDQSDKEEVGHQVALMGGIYGQASRTRIWLGLEYYDVASVFEFFSKRKHSSWRLAFQNTFKERSAQCVGRFLERPWFTRRWVVQELGLSRNAVFYVAHHMIEWNLIKPLIAQFGLLLHERDDVKLSDEARHGLLLLELSEDSGGSLLKRLFINATLLCEHPKDRLQAFHGLCARDPVWAAVATRCDSDTWMYKVSWQEFYKAISRYYIMNGLPHESVLVHVATFGSLADSCPTEASFYPDWSKPRKPYTDHWRGLTDPAEYTYMAPYSRELGIGLAFPTRGDAILARLPTMRVHTRISKESILCTTHRGMKHFIRSLLPHRCSGCQGRNLSEVKVLEAICNLVLDFERDPVREAQIDQLNAVPQFAWSRSINPLYTKGYDLPKLGADDAFLQDEMHDTDSISEYLVSKILNLLPTILAKFTIFGTECYSRVAPNGTKWYMFGIGLCDRSVSGFDVLEHDLIVCSKERWKDEQPNMMPCLTPFISRIGGENNLSPDNDPQDQQWHRPNLGRHWNDSEPATTGRFGGMVYMGKFAAFPCSRGEVNCPIEPALPQRKIFLV